MPGTQDARALQIVDPVLTEVARQYASRGFIYSQLAPSIPVNVLTSQYPVYDERYFFQDVGENKLADREETPEIELTWSLDSFTCEDYGLKSSITPRERAMANAVAGGGPALRLESSKLKQLVKAMLIRRERRLAAQLRKTTNGGQLNLGGAATTAFVSSTAVETDWETAKSAAYSKTGLTPNVAVIPYLKAVDLALNPTLRDIWKYQVNSGAYITLGEGPDGEDMMIPRVFHGTRIIVPKGALYQGGHEGAAKSLAEIWGTSVRFLYVDPDADWGVPSTCYSFTHPVLTGDGRAAIDDDQGGFVVDRWQTPDPRVEYVRAVECVDEKVCAPDAGYELTGV